MKKNFPPKKLSNNCDAKSSLIMKSIGLCLALGLLTTLNNCTSDNIKHKKLNQENIVPERLVNRNSLGLDTILVQQAKGEAQQVLGDPKTRWYLDLLHAMMSPERHLPTQEHKQGKYRSIYIDSLTYIIMEYNDYTIYPYGINGNSQIVLNKKRIEGLCNGIGLIDDQRIKVTEAIWLQEIYEYQKTQSTGRDTVNLFGEVVSLMYGGPSYLFMRMHTLNKPELLLAKLQGQQLMTETYFGGYESSEKFYEEGMIKYLKSIGYYDSFLQESTQETKGYNNYLIQQYFSDTKNLYEVILE